MSEELSIYLKPKKRKEEDKEPQLLHLASYTRGSDIFGAIDSVMDIAYYEDESEESKTELTPDDMKRVLAKQKETAENVAQMLSTRKEALVGVSNTDVADDIISDIDRLVNYQKEIDEGLEEVKHLSYLINTIYSEREYSWSGFEKVLADIG